MPATSLDRYRHIHPDLLPRLLAYFEARNADRGSGGMRPRMIREFIEYYRTIHPESNLQPQILVEICRRFVAYNWLSEVNTGGFSGLENSYINSLRDPLDIERSTSVRRLLTCAVYGFAAVYDEYGSSVLPLTNRDARGDTQIGTCFAVDSRTLITALHCVAPATAVSIRGVSPDHLRTATWSSYVDPHMDLACISFDSPVIESLPPIPIPESDATILDEVMAVGFPSVPGFHPSLAAEAATISSRLTTVAGRVASIPTEIWTGAEMFLITARVRGGFSGGPIFDRFGQAVGVVSREPVSEHGGTIGHRFDNAGYGTAIPASVIQRMRSAGRYRRPIDMSRTEFENFR